MLLSIVLRHRNVNLASLALLLVIASLPTSNAAATAAAEDTLFPLSIIHINDFHARFEPTDTSGGTCDPHERCIGGLARTVHTVRRLLKEQKDKNPVYFNAGDNFQGTLWYNVGRWNVTSQFLNILPADAMTLGNHEFDHGVDGLVPFLEAINSTVLVANIDTTNEPGMTGKYKKSMILERSNRKIGVIGVIIESTYDLANTGNVIFLNESIAVREEALKLKAQGANIIVVISHCGYDVDKIIAMQAGDEIDVIVGAHSHTFLYSGDKPPGPDVSKGDYPTEVLHASGHRVLIVQAAAYAKYVGNITVFFDDNGNLVRYEGAPIYMGFDVPQDAEVVEAMKPWKEIIDEIGNVVIGETAVDLEKTPCGDRECNLGNFYCDAMVHAFIDLAPFNKPAWTNVSIGLVNTGALRVPLFKGNLTYAHIVTMSPFENILTAFNLTGDKLREALEYAVSPINLENNVTTSYLNLQVAGLRITYNYRKPVGKRVVDIKVRCADCEVPKYEPYHDSAVYRIVAPNFLVEGGDGYHMLRDSATDLQGEMTDLEALLKYIKHISPVTTGIDGRITVLPKTSGSSTPQKFLAAILILFYGAKFAMF